MSAYVGIDLSTHAVDLVKLDEASDRAEWVRVPLVGENAIDRARSYRRSGQDTFYPRGMKTSWWDDVILCALEDPAGRGDTRKIARVQGVVIATIPARVQVWTLQPSEWRRHCGLKGNASKADVADFAIRQMLGDKYLEAADMVTWPNDATDAYAVAYAARAINQTQEEAA